MPQAFDVIVLGTGAMGASATYQLAKRGVRVLGIDQYDPPHTLGSTHGETRITRIACGEGEIYTRLARRSHEIWPEIERERAQGSEGSLMTSNGLIVIAGPAAAKRHGNARFLENTADNARKAGVAWESLNAEQIRSRYPAFRVNDDEKAYLDHVSGFLRPEACVTAQLSLARKHGAVTHVNETVKDFEAVGGGVEVRTNKATYAARRLIITAGAWLPHLLKSDNGSPFVIQRQVLYWFAPHSEEDLASFKQERFPVFIWLVPDRPLVIYGFPALGGMADGIKIAAEENESSTTLSSVNRTVSDREKTEMYETYIRPFFPGLSSGCVRAEVCLYTKVKDGRFIIDRHPSMDNVIIASPCSGHGFKHSPAIGELLAQMALEQSHIDISEFALHQ